MNTEPYTHYGTLRDPKKHTRAQRSVGLVVVGSSRALVAAAWVAAVVATAVLTSLGREARGVQPPGYISIAHSRASQADRVGHVSRRPNEKGWLAEKMLSFIGRCHCKPYLRAANAYHQCTQSQAGMWGEWGGAERRRGRAHRLQLRPKEKSSSASKKSEATVQDLPMHTWGPDTSWMDRCPFTPSP